VKPCRLICLLIGLSRILTVALHNRAGTRPENQRNRQGIKKNKKKSGKSKKSSEKPGLEQKCPGKTEGCGKKCF